MTNKSFILERTENYQIEAKRGFSSIPRNQLDADFIDELMK